MDNNNSLVNLLAGKITFTNEPLWYRLTVILIIAAFILTAIYFLHRWALPAIAAKGLSGINLKDIFKFRDKSP